MTEKESPFNIVDLNFVSLYFSNLNEAVAFYTKILGPPDEEHEEDPHYGWELGATWLTLFESKAGTVKGSNPRNAEFAIQLAEPGEVDRMYEAFLQAGARECMKPRDTEMYVPMRFGCVDDPFDVRIDIYCLIDRPAHR